MSNPTQNPSTPLLEAVDLAAERGERELFYGVSFRLDAGCALQIEGPNGAGKTTLLRTLCGLHLPTEGEVRWCGEALPASRFDYAREMLYVGHQAGVKDELNPEENLRMASSLRGDASSMEPTAALERLGLSAIGDRPCRTLSAGQKRRVALARLLVSRATLWILDEPFTALDPAGRLDVEQLLASHAAAGGMAVLTTHHTMDLGGSTVHRLHLDGKRSTFIPHGGELSDHE
jgi:heme exporter protein A